MIPHQQNNTHTHAGRHRILMGDIRRALGSRLARAKILSFGCSSGLECLDLKDVMPEASIFGCEIHAGARQKAIENCEGRARILDSRARLLHKFGPFDAILAMNVLCLYPKTAGLENVSDIYSFDRFDAAAAQLDEVLAPGGLLTIYNGQYFLEDSSVAGKYEPLEGLTRPLNGWIEKSLPSGERATDVFHVFEGKTYSRTEWADHIAKPEVKDYLLKNVDASTYHHVWRKPELAGNRSTTCPIWRKIETAKSAPEAPTGSVPS